MSTQLLILSALLLSVGFGDAESCISEDKKSATNCDLSSSTMFAEVSGTTITLTVAINGPFSGNYALNIGGVSISCTGNGLASGTQLLCYNEAFFAPVKFTATEGSTVKISAGSSSASGQPADGTVEFIKSGGKSYVKVRFNPPMKTNKIKLTVNNGIFLDSMPVPGEPESGISFLMIVGIIIVVVVLVTVVSLLLIYFLCKDRWAKLTKCCHKKPKVSKKESTIAQPTAAVKKEEPNRSEMVQLPTKSEMTTPEEAPESKHKKVKDQSRQGEPDDE